MSAAARCQALEGLALGMLDEHGLLDAGWTFRWTTARTIMGACNYRDRVVKVSRPLFLVNDDDEGFDTVAHEVAHALAGPGAGHGPAWVRACAVTGARPVSCADGNEVAGVPHRWLGVCGHGCEYRRHRLAASLRKGALCGEHRELVTWREEVSA